MSTECTASKLSQLPPSPPAFVPSNQRGVLLTSCPEIIGMPFSYAREKEVYGEGEDAESVYKVVSGAVHTHKMLSDGRRQITDFYLPGDLFGFEQGEAHRHTAEAMSDTKVLIFKRRQVERAATDRAEVACQLWDMATNSLRHMQDVVLLLGRRSALERVATFLLNIDDRLGATGTFDLPIMRRDLADYLGLTIETVSRTLSQLEGDGALLRAGSRKAGSRQVTLCRSRLRRIVED
ncbi:helix-turn-helix domain-containing protein [Methylobacterium sp. P31]